MAPELGDIHEATRSYERWLRTAMPVPAVESEVTAKHEQMKADPFRFFRGTFYRWAQVWPTACKEVARAPRVLAVGDLHVGSFGTWRDGEGRLCWGVDDFDEAYPLPYTNDLVRLAASVKMLIDSAEIDMKFRTACDLILEGYGQTLKEGGRPIVLAENETDLEQLGFQSLKPAPDFWRKLQRHPPVRAGQLPREAGAAIQATFPESCTRYKVVRRRAGLGSLGQPRFVAIANWQGGCIAREAKACLPSACVWLTGNPARRPRYYDQLIMSALRSRDPYQKVNHGWIVRRLSPDSNPIEITDLGKRDDEVLLYAMAQETANVHLGTREKVQRVLRDVRGRKRKWLRSSGKAMAKIMEREWEEYAAT
jgi:hypothetical protein